MNYEKLSSYTINMKSMNQHLNDIILGAGNVNGYLIRIIFSQETIRQLTPSTKIYLTWYNKDADIHGLNVFKQNSEKSYTWELILPKFEEGDVIAAIKVVDDISIIQSNSFIIHVLYDPDKKNESFSYEDYSLFEEAIMSFSRIEEQGKNIVAALEEELIRLKEEYENIVTSFEEELPQEDEEFEENEEIPGESKSEELEPQPEEENNEWKEDE